MRNLPTAEIDATCTADQPSEKVAEVSSVEDTRSQMMQHVRTMVKYWAELPGLSVEDRCDGVAFSIFTMLDGATALPRFTVSAQQEDGADLEINADCDLHDLYTAKDLSAG